MDKLNWIVLRYLMTERGVVFDDGRVLYREVPEEHIGSTGAISNCPLALANAPVGGTILIDGTKYAVISDADADNLEAVEAWLTTYSDLNQIQYDFDENLRAYRVKVVDSGITLDVYDRSVVVNLNVSNGYAGMNVSYDTPLNGRLPNIEDLQAQEVRCRKATDMSLLLPDVDIRIDTGQRLSKNNPGRYYRGTPNTGLRGMILLYLFAEDFAGNMYHEIGHHLWSANEISQGIKCLTEEWAVQAFSSVHAKKQPNEKAILEARQWLYKFVDAYRKRYKIEEEYNFDDESQAVAEMLVWLQDAMNERLNSTSKYPGIVPAMGRRKETT